MPDPSKVTIFHNPRCSKSREALILAQAFSQRAGVALDVVDYLKTPPDVSQLTALLRQLGVGAHEIVRSNEKEYAEHGLEHASDSDVLAAIAASPVLLQRPIVAFNGRAVIGRPPERLNELLDRQARPTD